MKNQEQLDKILTAKTAEELFGDLTNKTEITVVYRKLARNSHPDMFSDSRDKLKAQQAFIHLSNLWESIGKVSKKHEDIIVTKKHEYHLGNILTKTEMFTIFNATYDAGYKNAELFVTNNPKDTDLAAAHIKALKKIKTDVNPEYLPYFPKIIENLRYRQGSVEKTIIAAEKLDGMYSLREVTERYPEGINAKDVAWIFRRVLVALGNTHEIGLVHGSPNLDSLWIHPELHGLILNNWEYSVDIGDNLKALPQIFKTDYPESVFQKKPVDYKLDLMLAAKTMQKLLRPDAPKQINIFFKGCTLASTPLAADLLYEFDQLLTRLWGERKFHHFTMEK